MRDVVIKVKEQGTDPQRVFTAELWAGLPGAADAALLAGGNSPYTQAELEAPGADGIAMDRSFVLDKIRNQDGEDPAFTGIGVRLYELLVRTGVASEWDRLRQGTETGVRTYLDLPLSLAEWPWELLAWTEGPGLFVRAFNTPQHPILRLAPRFDAGLRDIESTVRILLVSGQEDLGGSEKASAELWLIRQAFHRANLSVLVELCEAPSDAVELQGRINRMCPHVLHFVGHGAFVPGGTEFILKFHRKNDWEWSTNEIFEFFRTAPWKPRLVVLNACNSAQSEASSTALATALLRAGVPAVVGALAALQVGYAREFAKVFYGALASGQLVDQAVVTARTALTRVAAYQGLNRRHWALPVLTVRAPAERILSFEPPNSAMQQCEIAGDVFARPGRFVNRTSDRWSMVSALRPPLIEAPRFRGVIVQGEDAQVGKTWLIRRAMRDFLDGRFLVRYASLAGARERTSLDVLEEWRGLPNTHLRSPVLSRLPDAPFAAFDKALAAARANRTAATVDEVFGTFKEGLQRVRGEKDVLLVLGRFREITSPSVSSQDFREHLLERILLPIRAADTDVAGVCALLLVRRHSDVGPQQPRDFDEFALARLSDNVDEGGRRPSDGFRRITLKPFAPEEVDRHFDEFSEFTENDGVNGLRLYVKYLVKNAAWSPNQLKEVETAMAQLLKR